MVVKSGAAASQTTLKRSGSSDLRCLRHSEVNTAEPQRSSAVAGTAAGQILRC